MADSALAISTLGTGSVYLMGLNSAVNTAKGVVDGGGTTDQALKLGIAAGVAEVLFEKLSVDNLLKPKTAQGWRDVLTKVLLTQGGIELSEEALTETANILAEMSVLGQSSDYAKAVQGYREAGDSEDLAKQKAFLDMAGRVGWAGAGGFISGIGMSGVYGATQYLPAVRQSTMPQVGEVSMADGMGQAGREGLFRVMEARQVQGDAMTAQELAEGYTDVYLAGLNGVPLDQSMMAGPNAQRLTAAERAQAYNSGLKDARARVEENKRQARFAQVAGTEKGLVMDDYVRQSVNVQEAELVNTLLKRLGLRGQFVDHIGAELAAANGSIDNADIRIAKDADQPWLVVLGHEVGHRLEQTAPEAYQVFRQFADQHHRAEVEGLMELYARAGKTLNYDDALREFANNDIGRLIGDPQALQNFFEENKSDRTFIQKVADALRALWQKLTGQDRQQVKTAEEALVAALKASEAQAAKLERMGQVQEFSGEPGSMEYSIGYDVNNTPFVTVEEDILAGVPQNQWVQTVRRTLKEKFPDGVTVGRSHIDIGRTTKRETTWGRYTQWLRDAEPGVYADKMRALGSADEILKASTGYVNEDLNHPRKDDIIDFARGTVQLRIGENDYTAEVVVGGKKDGSMVLYDVLYLAKTKIKEKTQTRQTANPSPGSGRNTVADSSESMIAQPGDGVNGDLSLQGTAQLAHEAKVLSGLPFVDLLGSCGRTGLTHLLESRQGDAITPQDLAEAYAEFYSAGFMGEPLPLDRLPANASPKARLLTIGERIQAYYNGVNDFQAIGQKGESHTDTSALQSKEEEGTIDKTAPAQLTDEETSALVRYKSSESYKINEMIRDGLDLTPEQRQMMEDLDTALPKLPVYQGQVYRRLSFDLQGPEVMEAFLAEHQPGAFVEYEAYTSTSSAIDGYVIKGDLVVTMVIESETGRNMDGYGNNFENEVLFQRECHFYVERVESDIDGRPVIYMKEVVKNALT